MQIGVWLSWPVDELEGLPAEELARIGLWAVVLRCFEDEVRWRAGHVAAAARRLMDAGLRVFLAPAGYGLLAPESHASSLFVAVHPQTRQIDQRGRPVPRACPNNPTFLEWFAASIRTLVWLVEADGVIWEEPGFCFGRGLWTCRCEYCQRLYFASHGEQMPRELTPTVAAFRQRSMCLFLMAANAAVKSVDKSLAAMVAPTPAVQPGAVATGTENWQALAQNCQADALVLTYPPSAQARWSPQAAADLYRSGVRWTGRGVPILVRVDEWPDGASLALLLRRLKNAGAPAVLIDAPHREATEAWRELGAAAREAAG